MRQSICLLFLFCSLPVWAFDTSDPVGERVLAEKMATLAQAVMGAQSITDSNWQQSESLLEAAARLNPSESRFQKLLFEARIELDDRKGALEALKAYSALEPDDQWAQCRIISMYALDMESADARLKYYTDLVEIDTLAAPVRSFVASQCAQLMFDRSQDEDGVAMLKRALEFNPVNPEAVRMNYEIALARGTAADRVIALGMLLRSNPAQPAVMVRMADELADAGLLSDSITWYQLSFATGARLGVGVDGDAYLDCMAALILSDQTKQADATLQTILSGDPTNVTACYLHLLCARRSGDKDAIAQAIELARTAMLERLYATHRAIANADPTTQPSGDLASRLPDLAADVRKLQELKDDALTAAFIADLSDLAWLQIYFAGDAASAAPLVDALRSLLPPDNDTVPRLEGWTFLANSRNDEARVKLSAVAPRDPLSALGMLRLADSNEQAVAQAGKLLSENPSGLMGAFIADAVRELGAKPAPMEGLEEVKAALAKFPKRWLDFLEKPQEFYALRGDGLKVSHAFGEPMYADITLVNNSEFDIALGEDGAIRSDLWIDAGMRGPGNLPITSYERLNKVLVLKRGVPVTQRIRIDNAQMNRAFEQAPIMAWQIYVSFFTNPVTVRGQVIPGPGGVRAMLKRVVERSGSPQTLLPKLTQQLSTGNSDEKIRATAVLAEYARGWSNEKAPDEAKAQAKTIVARLEDVATDPSPCVSAWAAYVLASLQPNEKMGQAIQQLAAHPYWVGRVIALAGSGNLPREDGNALCEKLKSDPDPIVARFAAATQEELKKAPATQPTTQPGGQQGDPTTQPGAPGPTTQPEFKL